MSNFYTNVSKWGNNILLREMIDGEIHNKKIPFEPTLFISSNTETGYKGFFGENLAPKVFDKMSDARDFIKQYKDMPGFDVHGNDSYVVQFISEQYPKEIDYKLDQIRICNFDIENDKAPDGSFAKTDNPLGAITAITVYDNIADMYHVYSTLEWHLRDTTLEFITMDNVDYNLCSDEKDLLIRFINHVHSTGYHVLTGWNIEGYDIPYLINRCYMEIGEKATKRLSPWGIINNRTGKDNFGNDREIFDIVGLAILDYLVIYKNFTYVNQESYTLDHIGYVEVGQNKLDIDGAELHALSRTDPQRFLDYNIQDVNLVRRIDEKMKLIELIYTLSYYARVNVTDIISPVKTWDAIIYNRLKNKNIVVPPVKHHSKLESYAGAFVKEPRIGFSDWIISVDLNSEYPHLIMQYNLGTDTILDEVEEEIKIEIHNGKRFVDERLVEGTLEIKSKNIVAANGTTYRRDKRGVLAELMDEVYKLRKIHKKTMLGYEQRLADGDNSKEVIDAISKYNNLQMAMKILLNSAYGATGNKHFRYFDLRIAEAITISGQQAIRWIARKINIFMNNMLKSDNVDYVIAIDTDSNYIDFSALVNKVFSNETDKNKIVDALDKFCADIFEPFLKKSYDELAVYMNAYENKMQMDREVIADRGFWTAKKRYVLNVWDSEGVRYSTPKLKVMGLESKKSSSPQICRDKLKAGYKMMIDSDNSEMIKFIADFESEWNKMSVVDISFPRGCNGVTKYADELNVFGKKCPPHVKGALYHNKLIKDLGLENDIETIKNGDKVKFVPLREPNPARTPFIAFKGKLPKEFKLDNYIDYDKQFNKSFLEPMKLALNAVNWTSEEVNTLEGLFG